MLPGFGVEVVFGDFVGSEAIGLVVEKVVAEDFVNFVVVVAVEIVANLVN